MSKLRGIKPTTIEKRFKALVFGPAGCGKSTFCTQFPRPYYIDTERGAENDSYTRAINKGGGVIFQTSDFSDIMQEVHALTSEQHDYRTLVIDPITPVYDSLLDECAKKTGEDFGRHYGAANKLCKRLFLMAMRLDMNVIITAHSKNEYGDGMKVIGQVPDGWKKLEYVFDLVLCLSRARDKQGKRGARIATIVKSRVEQFDEGDSFEWSYDAVADRYGRDILERDAVPIELVNPEQVEQLNKLLAVFQDDKRDKLIKAALKKAGVEALHDLPAESVVKWIEHLEKQEAAA